MDKFEGLEYALILRKFELNNGIFLYRPERVSTGYVDNGIFFPEKGQKNYNSIEDEYFNYSSEDEGYYLLETKHEIIEEYLSGDDDDITFFEKRFSNSVFIGSLDSNEEFTIKEISINELLKEENLGYDFYPDGDSMKIECTLTLDKVIDILEENDYDKEKINEVIDHIKEERQEIEKYFRGEINELNLDFDRVEVYEEEYEEEKSNTNMELIEETFNREPVPISPKDQARILYRELKERIIGQDEAIKTICYILYKNSILDDKKKKTNCLLVGPTGCGKSEIINIIAEVYKKPLVHVDSNSNTAAGYVGDSLTDNLATLMIKANGNQEVAEHGIIAFDEIDKRGDGDRSNVNGKLVLDGILRFAEGQEYNVEYRTDNSKKNIIFDTSNLTIFASGAFPEVFKERLKKLTKGNSIGFNGDVRTEQEKKQEIKDLEKQIELTHEDIATTGKMGPEFTGRFLVTTLHKLDIDDLKRIMTESTISPLKDEIDTLAKDNIEFNYDDNFITYIAKKAYNEGSGGRGIRNNIEEIFKEVYEKIIFEEDESLISEDGKIKLNGSVNEEGKISIYTKNGKDLLYKEEKKNKVKKL